MGFFDKKHLPSLILFLLALLLYGNTLRHGFVLDDHIVLTQNTFVKQGFKGIGPIFSNDTFTGYSRLAGQDNSLSGGRYRPLSLVIFAVLYQFLGENEAVFHGLAILLFAVSGVILYRLIRRMLNGTRQVNKLAWFVAALFVAHPIHTEVVANVKSCDEQLALLLGMGAWLAVFQAFDTGKKRAWLTAGLLFLAACLSKENAVLLAVTTPLALWFFRKTKFTNALRHAFPLFAGAAVFLLLRAWATAAKAGGPNMAADPLNDPFLQWNGSAWVDGARLDKLTTAIFMLGQQLRLLLFPYPLTHDYYHLDLQKISSPGVWVSLFLLMGLIIFGLYSMRQRQRLGVPSFSMVQVTGFGILFLLLTVSVTANIFFPVGAFMAERFLYLPSVGFCLGAVMLAHAFFDKYAPKAFLPTVGAVIVVFAALTILRNRDWKSNEVLTQADIRHSANSPKLNNDLGTLLMEKGMKTTEPAERRRILEEAFVHLSKALERHPTFYDAYLAHGACAYYLERYATAVSSYRTAYKLYPQDPKSKLGLQYSLQALADNLSRKSEHAGAISNMTEAWQLQPDTLSALHLSAFYRATQEWEKSVEWLQKAYDLAPNDQRLKQELETAKGKAAEK